jgi:hypothetical protein
MARREEAPPPMPGTHGADTAAAGPTTLVPPASAAVPNRGNIDSNGEGADDGDNDEDDDDNGIIALVDDVNGAAAARKTQEQLTELLQRLQFRSPFAPTEVSAAFGMVPPWECTEMDVKETEGMAKEGTAVIGRTVGAAGSMGDAVDRDGDDANDDVIKIKERDKIKERVASVYLISIVYEVFLSNHIFLSTS